MEYRELGKSGLAISEISLGCWVMGGDYWGGAQDADSIAAIRQAIDSGINFIDTAELYGRGRSEEVVGRALEGRRDSVYISTKVWKDNMRFQDVKRACEGSLRRLQTDYIDVYFIHYPYEEVPLEETMAAMVELQQEGKIRAIGVSNFSRDQLQAALALGPVEVVQPCYSLLWRFIEADLLPFCIEHEIGVVAYSPLAQGILTGKFRPGHQFGAGDRRPTTPLFQPERFEACIEVAEALVPFAQRYGKTQGQVALNWVTAQPGITSAIVGARNAAQVKENVGAAGWRLDPADVAAIDQIGRRVTDTLPRFVSFFHNRVQD